MNELISFVSFLFHDKTGVNCDLLEISCNYRGQLSTILDISTEESSEGELAAMVSYAIAFPDGFMALVDTYDVKRYHAYRHLSLGFSFLSSLFTSFFAHFFQFF